METKVVELSRTGKYFNTIVDFTLAVCFTKKIQNLEPSTHGMAFDALDLGFFVVRNGSLYAGCKLKQLSG